MGADNQQRTDLSYIKHYEDWHSEEWDRQFATSTQLENHAITFLTTANGGAAAAAIAFLATAQVPHGALYLGLSLFTAGLILCGGAIGYGHTQMRRITDGLVADILEFRAGALAGEELHPRNCKRHEEAKLGLRLAWGSFIALIGGIVFSGVALYAHMEQKQAENKAKPAAQLACPPQPATSKAALETATPATHRATPRSNEKR